MENNTMMQQQIENQYRAAAKQLYNMALFSIGDKGLAEQTAAGVFADALEHLKDTSDIEFFRKHCCTLLYQYCKNIRRQYFCPDKYIADEAALDLRCVENGSHLSGILICLSFEERFIVLLFCLQKYSVRQIAQITRLPCFIIEKRLMAAVGRAATLLHKGR